MSERILFGMPSDPELFLAALAAVQGWRLEQDSQIAHGWAELQRITDDNDRMLAEKTIGLGKHQAMAVQITEARKRQTDREYVLTLYGDWNRYKWLQPAFGAGVHFTDVWDPQRLEWDLVYQFNETQARQVAGPTMRHAANAFGLLIGAGTITLPDLSAIEMGPYTDNVMISVLLLPWEGRDEVVQMIRDYKPDLSYSCSDLSDPGGLVLADMVVGPRSPCTYIAASMGRRVVEIYPDSDYKNWLAKWDAPNYAMLYGNAPAGLVWRAMDGMWRRPARQLIRPEPTLKTVRTQLHGMPVGQIPAELV